MNTMTVFNSILRLRSDETASLCLDIVAFDMDDALAEIKMNFPEYILSSIFPSQGSIVTIAGGKIEFLSCNEPDES